MRWQVLASGSAGNALLVRAGETRALLDCGLTGRALVERLEQAKAPPPFAGTVHHIVLTHGHLDHTRSAGMISRASRATIHSTAEVQRNRSLSGAHERRDFTPGTPFELTPPNPDGESAIHVTPVAIPHDAHPTVALRLEHEGRVGVLLTDMGRPDDSVAAALADAHLLQIEFNHDAELLASGPYPAKLKRRVLGDEGHLSNAQASAMLGGLVGPRLHTVVLAHLSLQNNRPELALAAARTALDAMGRSDVRVVVADQHEIGENFAV